MMARVVVHLCATCEAHGFAHARDALQTALDAAGLHTDVVAQPCMNACAEPVSLALQSQGRATYFFTGIDPVADRADIVATVAAYLKSPGGWVDDATACGRLRHCLKGRVPALSSGS
jgi:predicted metal-binding protein